MSDAFTLATATGGKPFERSATSLLGPADADHFRIKVGRYGDRWYCDPLPADDVWPEWDGSVPSISTIKKASGSDWSFVAMKRINTALEERPNHFDGMDFDARYEAMKAINKLGLSAAAKRGTNVHLYAEAKLHGSTWRIPDGAPGHEYIGAVDAWFDQHQPELVAAEYVVIKRELDGGIGYGGTPDGLLRIAGLLYAIDWKSRGIDSDHGAYPEEAEQIAAGVQGDYMIVAGPNGAAQRQPIPEVAGGLIVSIRPDGARSYPIELEPGGKNWRARHAWWVARLDERKPVGKPWPIGKKATVVVETVNVADYTRDNLLRRCRTVAEMSPQGAEWLKAELVARSLNVKAATPAEFPLIVEVLEQAETMVSAPFDPLPAETGSHAPVTDQAPLPVLQATAPDEGWPVIENDAVFGEMKAAYAALDAAGKSWVGDVVAGSIQAGRSLHMVEARTLRRVRVALGLALLASESEGEEATRALVHLATGVDAVLFPSVPLGAAVSIMSANEAEVFVGAVRLLLAGLLEASVDSDGHVRLAQAA
jgi:hypothetical protein